MFELPNDDIKPNDVCFLDKLKKKKERKDKKEYNRRSR